MLQRIGNQTDNILHFDEPITKEIPNDFLGRVRSLLKFHIKFHIKS